MKKISKKFILLVIVLAFALSNFLPFISMKVVHADPEKVWLQFDSATISGSNIIFDVNGTDVTVSVSGSGYVFNEGKLEITYSEIGNVKLTVDDVFRNNNMKMQLHDGREITINGDNEAVLVDVDFTSDDAPHVQVVSNNQGGGQGEGPQGGNDTSNYEGNGVSTLNYSINGVIEYTSGGGYDHGITFKINGIPYRADESKMVYTEDTAYERDENGQLILDNNNNPIVVKDPETMQPMTEKTGLTITGDTINYDYDTNTNKVKFTFAMAPGTLMTGLKINDQVINNLPSTPSELEACYNDHKLEIEVDDIDKADTYNIEITARYPNANEQFLGNFLWDYNPQGYTGPDDKILNATLVFVEAEYNGHVYTTEDEINALGGVYIWRDAERKKKYTDDREGVGEAQFPTGTKLTVKIIPDAGYQLVNFGINGGVFDPQEEIGTYQFEVQGGPFHLQATIEQVEDVVKTTSEKVSAGAITLGNEETMSVGTARLDVKDIELTEEQISNFEEASNGYEIKNYLDISLFNTVYKGSSSESWDTQVKDLDNEAEIILKLEDDVNGEDIVIVHEKHDGTYEIIPTEYIKEYNAIVFKTKSFSNYAIASKASTETSKTTNTANPKTGDNVMIYISSLILSIIGFVGLNIYSKKKKIN